MLTGLSTEQLHRLVEIMREQVPRPVGTMLVREYHLATVRHDFIDALEQLAQESGNRPADKENPA